MGKRWRGLAATAAASAVVAAVLLAHAGRPASPAATPAPAAAEATTGLRLPPPAARADYQLGGGYPLPPGTRIVTRDRTERPAAGAYGICYLNAFQTQPDQTAWWRSHHPGLLLRDAAGHEVGDPGWPGEVLLDTRTTATRAGLIAVLGQWVDGCARSGFVALEPDNLDSWTRSHGLLSQAANLSLARLLVQRAHRVQLAVGQKNTSELGELGRQTGFDFAVAEQCQQYDECDAYNAVYGARVIEIKYSDEGRAVFDSACRLRHGRASIVYRDRELGRPGDPGYAFATC